MRILLASLPWPWTNDFREKVDDDTASDEDWTLVSGITTPSTIHTGTIFNAPSHAATAASFRAPRAHPRVNRRTGEERR